jgi:hypothetical protein
LNIDINDAISRYINEKNKEIWVNLSEVDENQNIKSHLQKIKMSHSYSKDEILTCVQNAIKVYLGKDVEKDFISLQVDSYTGSNGAS